MDNASIHKTDKVKEAIQQAGHRVKYLPPYTPHFNLAEWVFGQVKPIVGRRNPQDRSQLTEYIDDGLKECGARQASGWMEAVLRWVQLAAEGQELGRLHDASDALQRLRTLAHESTESGSRDSPSRDLEFLNLDPDLDDEDDDDSDNPEVVA